MNPSTEAHAGPRAAISAQALSQFGEWLAAGQLPQVIPTRQERSLRTCLALLEAGRELLVDRPLEELSVEIVCQHAQATVGAFYGRFENKHAFFLSMQRLHVLRSQASRTATKARRGAQPGFDALCRDMVTQMVDGFRSNPGVLRASLQHTREGMWEPFRALGDANRSALVSEMTPHLTHLPARKRKLRILFAYQVLAGTLVHAVLNNPGPLRLDDAALVPELMRIVKGYLLAPDQERAG